MLASVLAALTTAVTACTPNDETAGTVTVYSAASLRTVFEQLAAEFEREHPGVRVDIESAGSQQLRARIDHGGRADIFVPAAPHHAEGIVTTTAPEVVVCNRLALATPAGNPASIDGLTELRRAGRVVVGVDSVPIGDMTRLFLEGANSGLPGIRRAVEAQIVSRELSVAGVITRLALGEADAGFVYGSDVATRRDIVEVPLPEHLQVTTSYAATLISNSPNARAFFDFITSEAARRHYLERGFQRCAASEG